MRSDTTAGVCICQYMCVHTCQRDRVRVLVHVCSCVCNLDWKFAQGGVWLGELGGGPLEVDPDTTGGFSNCKVHARPKYQDTAVEVRFGSASLSADDA